MLTLRDGTLLHGSPDWDDFPPRLRRFGQLPEPKVEQDPPQHTAHVLHPTTPSARDER